MPEPQPRVQNQTCIVIPARFASTRFPGKPLARLTGAGGIQRSLIEWTWRAALKVPDVEMVLVATDDVRIVEEVERFGGVAVMTPSECANGTERCAAALLGSTERPDIVINFQGDAPLTPPDMVTALIDRMRREPDLQVATPAIRCRNETYRHLTEDRSAGRVGGTTVVFDRDHHALYFSKNVIPFVPSSESGAEIPVHLHIGVYAYRPTALTHYVNSTQSPLEMAEGLEQLRFLDIGIRIGVVLCKASDGSMIELNNPVDAPYIEAELVRRNL